MRRTIVMSLVIIIVAQLMAACGTSSGSDSSVAVEAYLDALVSKDADRLTALSCADWESQATIELDSFQAVEAKLADLDCSQSGSEGDTATVTCAGKIVATYGDEDQEIDLSNRTYLMVKQGGEWLVCGVK